MTIFRWKNCRADIYASKHDLTIQSFLDNVVQPSIQFLETKISELHCSEDETVIFEISAMGDVLRETKLAFCLSIQSIWERQLRGYLKGCANQLRPEDNLDQKIEQADWPKLCSIFLTLRGIALSQFPSYKDLETLHLLGNACRHGDGASAVQLLKQDPGLWPPRPPMPPEFQVQPENTRPVAMMDIPTSRIIAFVEAIVMFWGDMEYIYNESIDRKHPSLEARLVIERSERSWLPRAAQSN